MSVIFGVSVYDKILIIRLQIQKRFQCRIIMPINMLTTKQYFHEILTACKNILLKLLKEITITEKSTMGNYVFAIQG